MPLDQQVVPLDKRSDDDLAQLEVDLAGRKEKFLAAKAEGDAAIAAALAARQLGQPDAPTPRQFDEARAALRRLDDDIAGIDVAFAQIADEKQRRKVAAEVATLEAQRLEREAVIDEFVKELDGLDKAIIALCKRFASAEAARLRVYPLFPQSERTAMPSVARPDGLRATARLWLAARSNNILAPMHGLLSSHQLIFGEASDGRPPRPSMADEGRVLHNIAAGIVAPREN